MVDYADLGLKVVRFVDRIEEHIDDPTYSWALDTLEGIRDDVTMKGRFTERQEEAVTNIEAAVERRADL